MYNDLLDKIVKQLGPDYSIHMKSYNRTGNIELHYKSEVVIGCGIHLDASEPTRTFEEMENDLAFDIIAYIFKSHCRLILEEKMTIINPSMN